MKSHSKPNNTYLKLQTKIDHIRGDVLGSNYAEAINRCIKAASINEDGVLTDEIIDMEYLVLELWHAVPAYRPYEPDIIEDIKSIVFQVTAVEDVDVKAIVKRNEARMPNRRIGWIVAWYDSRINQPCFMDCYSETAVEAAVKVCGNEYIETQEIIINKTAGLELKPSEYNPYNTRAI